MVIVPCVGPAGLLPSLGGVHRAGRVGQEVFQLHRLDQVGVPDQRPATDCKDELATICIELERGGGMREKKRQQRVTFFRSSVCSPARSNIWLVPVGYSLSEQRCDALVRDRVTRCTTRTKKRN